MLRLLSLTILLSFFHLAAAPVPPYRPKPQPSIVGGWKMQWNGGGFYFTAGFGKDGYFECSTLDDSSPRWQGRWKLEGRVLTVTERFVADPDSREAVWSVILEPGKLRGVHPSGATFELKQK